MRERRERVNGPYRKGRRWRVVIVGAGSEGDRSTHSFETEDTARQFIAITQKQIESRTLSWAVTQYIASHTARVAEREITQMAVDRYEFHLRKTLKLSENGGLDLRRLTPNFARKLYDQRGGAVDTHRNGLSVAKAFGASCVARGWLKVNPFAGIKGKGRRRHGKPKLRFDEARTFSLKCLELAPTDDGAVLSLAYLILGTRAGEILNREVRDLDDDGRLLWIPETKSEAGRRCLEVPDVLSPHLRRLAEGRPALAILFAACEHRARRQDWAREQVTRLCKLAGVPRVTPHGLRGTQGTLAKEAGSTSTVVAAALGHASPEITERAYIDRDRAGAAQRRSALKVLAGGLR